MNESTLLVTGKPAKAGYLSRLLDLLEAVCEAEQVTLTELAARTDIPLSTASRLVELLVEREMAYRAPGGGYGPGPRLVHLGLTSLERFTRVERIEEVLGEVLEEVKETVSAGLLIGDRIVLVARRESDHGLRVVASVGDLVPAHTTAMGKAVLANLPEERRRAVLRQSAGEEAAKEERLLEAELEAASAENFARDEELYAVGQRCRGVALLDANGQAYGAISVAGPAARFTAADADASVPALTAGASRLSLVATRS